MDKYFRKYKSSFFICMLTLVFAACGKDKYFEDGGTANGRFQGDMLALLKSKPVPFDTVAQIVELAGMKEYFEKEEFTFFSPTDLSIRETIRELNFFLNENGKDTILKLDEIDGAIWKKYLSRYIMPGINMSQDYPQIDFDIRPVYAGLNTYNITGSDLFNIGTVYNDVTNDKNTVRYIGYRQIAYSYIPDPSKPLDRWITAAVATVDLKPNNGVVHVLSPTIPDIAAPVGSGGTGGAGTVAAVGSLPASTAANLFGFGGAFLEEVFLSR